MIENLPIDLQNRIKEYIPRDRDMFSPTSFCIKQLIADYEDSMMNDSYWLVPEYKTYYLPFPSHVFWFMLGPFESEWNGIRGSYNGRSF